MNSYDQEALNAIQCYRFRCGTYPKQVEVPPEYLEHMSQREFVFQPAASDASDLVCVPVVLASSPPPDMIFKKCFVEQISQTSLADAEMLTKAAFHRTCAKLPEELVISEDVRTIRGAHRRASGSFYFYQMTAWVFGEEAILQKAMTEEQNLPGD